MAARYQLTDQYGAARFTTIYPGWYSGRTVHIHFKIRTDPDSDQGHEFTSQLFFDEAMTDMIDQQALYASKGYRDTLNADDNIFQSSEGLLTLALTEIEQDGEKGYQAIFGIGLDLSQPSPSKSGGSGGNPPAGGRPGNRPNTPQATATSGLFR